MDNFIRFLVCVVLLNSALFSAEPILLAEMAKDAPGAADHPLTGRYGDSRVLAQQRKAFDEYKLALGRTRGHHYNGDLRFDKTQTVEGAVTRTLYVIPHGRSTLEVLRNFEQRLEGVGFKSLFACALQQCIEDPDSKNDFSFLLYARRPLIDPNYNEARSYLAKAALESVTDVRYKAWSLRRAQGDVYAAIHVVTQNGGTMGDVSGVLDGHVLALVDIVELKAMETRIVTLSADQLSRSIADEGRVALYGLLFDHDQAEVKAESKAQLDEIAKYLQANPSVFAYVVGHTDDQGTLAYNLDLSDRRAQATVRTLAGTYRIDARRLTAKGVGPLAAVASNATDEGRARNRRVEIVERRGR